MAKAKLLVTVFDGARQVFPKPVIVALFDGAQRRVHWATHASATIEFSLPFTDGPVDMYRVVVGADGHRDAGRIGIRVKEGVLSKADLMLLPKRARFDFRPLTALAGIHPRLEQLVKTFLSERFGADDQDAYDRLQGTASDGLATLLNIASGFDGFGQGGAAPQGSLTAPAAIASHPLTFIDRLKELKPDRFFADAKLDMVHWLEKDDKTFKHAPSGLHPGADVSFKEQRYPEGNVQFTFAKTGDPNLLTLDSDIDLFADTASHLLLEVLPNDVLKPGSHTDPTRAYAMRWMSARRETAQSGLDFNPPFSIVPA